MPRTAPKSDYYVATTTGVYKIDGKIENIIEGRTIVSRNSALYRAFPNKFKPVERPAVEQATSAPGEKRG